MTRTLIQTFVSTVPKEWQVSCSCLPDDNTWLVGICDDDGNKHKLFSVPLDGEDRSLTGNPKRKNFGQMGSIRTGGAYSYDLKMLQGGTLVALFNKSLHVIGDDLKSRHNLKHSRDIAGAFGTPEGSLLTLVDDGSIVLQHWDPETGQKTHKSTAPKLYTGKMSGDGWYWRQFVKAGAMGQDGRLVLSTFHYQFEQTGNRIPEYTQTLRSFAPDGTELWRKELEEQSDAIVIDQEGQIWVFSKNLQVQCFSPEGEEVHSTKITQEERGWSWRSVHLCGDRLFLELVMVGGSSRRLLVTSLDDLDSAEVYEGFLAALSPSGETFVLQEFADDLIDLRAYGLD